jgi:hypothetical protein
MIYDVPLTEVDKTTLDKRFQDIVKKNDVFILDNVQKHYMRCNLPTLISLEFAGWESGYDEDYRKYLNVFIIHPHEEDLKEPIDAMSKLIDETSYFGDYDKLIDIKIHSLFNKEPS